MKRGLVLGKFMPLHIGHVALIEFAIQHCDELIVLVCASAKEPINGEQRIKWVRNFFKDESTVKPILLPYDESELPNTSESSVAVSKLWADYLRGYLPGIDIVFASEAYAAYLAGFLGCEYKIFNAERSIMPVSSTQIRHAPFKYWGFIPDAVKPFYTTKICLYGTESTGKTTITQRLAEYFKTVCVVEMAREILENTYECAEQHLIQIAELHAETINRKISEANKLLFVDTDINITRSYSKFLFGKVLVVPEWVETANQFDLYLYLDNDASYIQDGTRLSKTDRDRLNEYHKAELTGRHIEFKLLSGDWDEKFKQAVAIVETLLVK